MHIVAIYGVLEHVVQEKPAVGSQFLMAFPSDRIFKATKDVNVQFFIHSFTIFLMKQFL